MSNSCWECLRAERHNDVWPFYEADCTGCEARALASIKVPPTTVQKEKEDE